MANGVLAIEAALEEYEASFSRLFSILQSDNDDEKLVNDAISKVATLEDRLTATLHECT